MSNEGKKVKVSYVGTFDDGEVFDSTEAHGGDPLEFTCMAGQMIKGFDAAVKDMEVGQTVNVHIPCEEAYGARDEALVQRVPKSQVPNAEWIAVGQELYMQDEAGHVFPVRVSDVNDDSIELDLNHQMAGKDLNFEITLIEVEG